jgi:hypothetical protein
MTKKNRDNPGRSASSRPVIGPIKLIDLTTPPAAR